ncbi:MAG: hypothetical protein HN407_05615 [Chloroflexi bacterium]|nr:hypothetical protein [Chloroflexota bacterium]
MNVREIAQLSPNYSEINREERNYAAIFFAALCKPGNPEKFLEYCGFSGETGPEFGIYFEYAYLRDLWYKISNESIKKEIIQQKLKIKDIDRILNKSFKEINQLFGVGDKASETYIQFPGKWSIGKYCNNFPDDDDFLSICRFKWSFNIKPDIVIHLDKNRAICIEAKYESGEGSYPATNQEKAIFKARGIKYVRQMDLQKYMMVELLGLSTDFMFLVFKKEKSETHKVVSWSEAFGSVDMKEMPAFAVEMAGKISV